VAHAQLYWSVLCLCAKYSAIQRYETHTALVARTLFCVLVGKGTLLHGLTSIPQLNLQNILSYYTDW